VGDTKGGRGQAGSRSKGTLEEGEGVLVDRLLELPLLGVGHVAPDREAVNGLCRNDKRVSASRRSASARPRRRPTEDVRSGRS
jgi:hypothetical protein